MSRVVSVRMDDALYRRIKKAAMLERRTVSNYIEYATARFVDDDEFVSEEEMKDILSDPDFVKRMKVSADDIKKGRYRIVRDQGTKFAKKAKLKASDMAREIGAYRAAKQT